ncbi:MAG TPA: DUF302 domain-containing protein [Bacteroidales bacterium]|nr:DUF302 domain-containing protein [Bacteroidales bacterium]
MNKIIVEKKSKYDFEKTVDKLKSEAELDGWSIPAIHDLQQSLAKSGKSVRPVKVIEICKPAYSGQMLELNDERIISVMMPCRISVYEKNDGNVYISLLNTASMIEGMPEHIAKVMKAASDGTFDLVRSVEQN